MADAASRAGHVQAAAGAAGLSSWRRHIHTSTDIYPARQLRIGSRCLPHERICVSCVLGLGVSPMNGWVDWCVDHVSSGPLVPRCAFPGVWASCMGGRRVSCVLGLGVSPMNRWVDWCVDHVSSGPLVPHRCASNWGRA
eukprot:scaffold10973_cov149-Isochrysis_galbana.AAC.1